MRKNQKKTKNYKIKGINILGSNCSYELTPEWEYKYQELEKEVTNLKEELHLIKKDIDNYTDCPGLDSLEKIRERAEISDEKETGIKRINIFDRVDFDIVKEELQALNIIKKKYVNMLVFEISETFEDYNTLMISRYLGIPTERLYLTEEEFKLVKKAVQGRNTAYLVDSYSVSGKTMNQLVKNLNNPPKPNKKLKKLMRSKL